MGSTQLCSDDNGKPRRIFTDGSVLRFTNRAVRLPGGEHCSGVGIAPDLEVDTAMLNDLSRLVPRAIGASHVR